MFHKNIGTPGRLLRFAIACLLLIFAIWQKSWIALILSLFTFIEVSLSWCIVYHLLGKNSCPLDSNKKNP
jgi:ABC-type uncharacterized transport system permease subunit